MSREITLQTEYLEVKVLPGRGGKIISIMDREKRAEWLYQRDDGTPAEQSDGSFGKGDAFGFDEMFPTINPEGELPDHGDIWRRSWDILPSEPDSLKLRTGSDSNTYEFTREIVLRNRGLLCSYTVENRGSADLPCLWTPHPLFSFGDETEILIPPGLRTLRQAADGGLLGPRGSVHELKGKVKDLLIPGRLPDGTCYKFYSADPLDEGCCGLRDRRGTLLIRFSTETVPWLGFWINRGGWNNQYNMALEPATAPMDSPGEAEKLGIRASLGSREKREWAMEILLS